MKAGRKQHKAEEPDRDDEIGWNGEESKNLRQHEEHDQAVMLRRRSSRRRSQATNGIESSTIHALPTICPQSRSSEPNASHRKTTESTTSPTMLEANTARTSPRRTSGV